MAWFVLARVWLPPEPFVRSDSSVAANDQPYKENAEKIHGVYHF